MYFFDFWDNEFVSFNELFAEQTNEQKRKVSIEKSIECGSTSTTIQAINFSTCLSHFIFRFFFVFCSHWHCAYQTWTACKQAIIIKAPSLICVNKIWWLSFYCQSLEWEKTAFFLPLCLSFFHVLYAVCVHCALPIVTMTAHVIIMVYSFLLMGPIQQCQSCCHNNYNATFFFSQ